MRSQVESKTQCKTCGMPTEFGLLECSECAEYKKGLNAAAQVLGSHVVEQATKYKQEERAAKLGRFASKAFFAIFLLSIVLVCGLIALLIIRAVIK